MCRERKHILVEFEVTVPGGKVATATLDYFDVITSSHSPSLSKDLFVNEKQLTGKGIHIYV